jgi:menaquinol-cytochrome c reductase iron-sulfur subunit
MSERDDPREPEREGGPSEDRPPDARARREPMVGDPHGPEHLPEIPPDRRRFLAWLSAGIGAGAATALLVPWAGLFVTPAHRTDPRAWQEVGRVEDFGIGETVAVTYLDPAPLPWAGYASRNAAWLRRESADGFAAFTSYCTHVGCPVRWEEGARLFMCPCHGGAFHPDGTVAAGPPPRALDRYPVRIRDGVVEIQAVGVPAPPG